MNSQSFDFDRYYQTKSQRPDIRVVTDFQPYPSSNNLDEVSPMLDDLRVFGVTATLDRNSPAWVEKRRYIRDDMFFCIMEGHAHFEISGCPLQAKPGDLIHIPRGAAQSFGARHSSSTLIVVVHYTAEISESITLPLLLNFPPVFRLGAGSPISAQFIELARLFTLGPLGCRQSINSLMTLLLMSLIRNYAHQLDIPAGQERVVLLRRLLPAIHLLREDLATPNSVGRLAGICGISVAQFRRIFRSVFRESPIQHIQKLRVREACRFLQFTDMTIGEICQHVGYEQVSHFHKMFKKITKTTPRNYRENVSHL